MNFQKKPATNREDRSQEQSPMQIAIVGVACRLPGGVSGPESYWEMICGKRSGIVEVPPERWNVDVFYDPNQDAIASSVSKWAGFIDDIKSFDAGFFGISPREATSMDPQQRLLLECVFEAMQDSGISIEEFQAHSTGVFVGVSQSDYRLIQEMRLSNSEIFAGTGYALCINANRISHRFGLSGPSYAVDTACSSSMVALDQACLNIQTGACEMAIVSGVNVLAHPTPFVAFSKAGMLSSTGVVSTFDAKANGYVRGEGVGTVVLKPLAKALEAGDDIYAVIEATAVNQDGYTSTLTAPNQKAQRAMLETLCRKARREPSSIAFVEAHGTGTPVGDPIEAGAIGAVFGKSRDSGPVYVGSVKANIGHLESAAGISGLIKAALAIKHAKIPPNINFNEPNPAIPMDVLNIQVPTEVIDFPETDGRRYAVVNSFGFGGTNASALLSSPPSRTAPAAKSARAVAAPALGEPVIVPLAAASLQSLKQMAADLASMIESDAGTPLRDLAAGIARKALPRSFRAAVVATDRAQLVAGLRSVASGEEIEGEGPIVVSGEGLSGRRMCFVFTGQGSQWWAMGRQLLLHDADFRGAVEEFDAHFSKASGWSIKEELLKDEQNSRIDDTTVTQPALFALQSGIVALWRRYGVEPHCVVGHSIGEAAAMYTAGGISLESAAGFLDKRGTIRDRMSGKGAMAAVAMDVDDINLLLEDEDKIGVAAVNSPGSVTISGDVDAIDAFVERFQVEYPGKFIRKLRVDTAWHSYQLDEAEKWFFDTMKPLDWQPPAIPFVSTVTGNVESCFDNNYGWRNLRSPVLFQQGIEMALELGSNVFVEVGPHSTLAGPITGTCAAFGAKSVVINSLDRKLDDRAAFLAALGRFFVAGGDVNWRAVGEPGVELPDLPRYPWSKELYWKDSEEVRALLTGKRKHPLLGLAKRGATNQWETELNLVAERYIADHRLQQECIFPAAGYIEIILNAGKQVHGDVPLEVSDTRINDALFIGKTDEIIIHTVINAERDICRIYSHLRDADVSDWVLRAEGIVRPCQAERPKPVRFDPATTKRKPVDIKHLYDVSGADAFINYGPAFRTVTDLWMDRKTTSARISKSKQIEAGFDVYLTHPAMLDACLQITDPRVTLEGFSRERQPTDPAYLPVGAQTIRLFEKFPETVYVHAEQIHNNREDTAQGGFVVTDEAGNVLLTISGLMNRSLRQKTRAKASEDFAPEPVIENYVELSAAVEDGVEAGNWLLLCDDDRVATALSGAIEAAGGAAERMQSTDVDGPLAGWIADAISARNAAGELKGVVFGFGLGKTSVNEDSTTAQMLDAVEPKVFDLVALGQALEEIRDAETHPDIWILTRRARAIAGVDTFTAGDLVGAPLVALTRTVASESQEHRVSQIDLDEAKDAGALGQRFAEILFSGLDENEFLVRGAKVYAPRLQRTTFEEIPGRMLVVDKDDTGTNFQVTMENPGIIDQLRIQEVAMPPVGQGEVRIRISAVGLNFRDIMAATGLLPREAEDEPAWRTLGLEFGAVVAEVGPGVKGLKRGDRVMGMAKSCLQRYLTLPAHAVSRIPDHIALEEASTIPSAYATAYYALDYIGRLRKGEKVLIHVATGGVGLAAIQIAQARGAEIFATAGNAQKRAYLRKLGVKHVMNSRSLDFADEIMKITDGKGVDVILNSLPGDYIRKGLDIIAPYGRFLEIGKRDVYADRSVGLKALRKNVSLCVLDLAAMGLERPELMGEIFSELVGLFEKRELTPIAHTDFPVSKVAEAFKFMSQAKHIGKVVVSLEEPSFAIAEDRTKPFALAADGSYLVTGGSRGFGIAVAEWLSRSGAGQILLASRSGKVDKKDRPRVARIEKRGTSVVSVALDVTDEKAVTKLLREYKGGKFPVRGIIHGAAVIEDALLTQLDDDLIRRVVRPKVAGAWNIHQALKKLKMKPDFIVNFSSVAQVIGSPGQGNYVAANAFLDAIAQYWSAHGINGKTVDWGVLGDSGFVTRNDALESYMDSVGMHGVSDKDACKALEEMIRSSQTNVLFASLDWQKIARANPMLGKSARVAPLLRASSSIASEIRQELLSLAAEQRAERLGEFLRGEVGKVLKVDASQVPFDRPMTEMGLDSLSSFELKNRIETELDMTVPLSKFLQAPDIGQLSEILSQEMQKLADLQAADLLDAESGEGSADGDASEFQALVASDRQAGLLAASLAHMTTHQGAAAFENMVAVKVKQGLDGDTVTTALERLAERHPMLPATVVSAGPDGPTFAFDGPAPLPELAGEWSAETAAPLDFAKGELLRVTIAPTGKGKTVLAIRAHAGIADRWSVHLLLEELLTLCAGEDLPAAPARQQLHDLLQYRRYDMTRADAMRDRSFWYYATSPLARKVSFARRRRALVDPRLGCAAEAAGLLRIEMKVDRGRGEKLPMLVQGSSAIATSFGSGQQVLVAVRSANRGGSENGVFGVLESQQPLPSYGADFSGPQHVRMQAQRIASALGDHVGFDLFAFCSEFQADIRAANAAPYQFVLGCRTEQEVHPLERALAKGSAKVAGFALSAIDLPARPLLSDIEIDIVTSGKTMTASIWYDRQVVDEASVKRLAEELEAAFDEPDSAVAAE